MRTLILIMMLFVGAQPMAYGSYRNYDLTAELNDLLGEIDNDFRQYSLEEARDLIVRCFLTDYRCITKAYHARNFRGDYVRVVQERYTPTAEQINRAKDLNSRYLREKYSVLKDPGVVLFEKMNDLLGEIENATWRQYSLHESRDLVNKCFILKNCKMGSEYYFGFLPRDIYFKPSKQQTERAQDLLIEFEKF